jgi:hypothetical protein
MQKPLFCTMSAVLALALLALACSSCGRSPKLYPVTGKVTVNGTPAAGAAVFLERQGVGGTSEQTIMGIVREDGSFSLVSGPYGEGAPPGEYDVFVDWRHRAMAAKGPMGTDRLKGHYADRNHPRLHAVVNPEPTKLPPFDLTEVKVTQADLKEPVVTPRMPRELRGKKPGIYIDGKKVDEETAKKILREGPGGKKIQIIGGGPGVKPFGIGGPGDKSFMFKGAVKPIDGEPDQKKQKSP